MDSELRTFAGLYISIIFKGMKSYRVSCLTKADLILEINNEKMLAKSPNIWILISHFYITYGLKNKAQKKLESIQNENENNISKSEGYR